MARGHIPYRGEKRPRYPKPRKQIRNLRAERIRDNLTTAFTFFLSVCALIVGMVLYSQSNDGETLAIFICAFIFGLILTFMFRDAENINKFRKGYDFDESFSGLEKEIKDNE